MTMDIALRAIDWFAEHSAELKRIIVSFYGGEPLINVLTHNRWSGMRNLIKSSSFSFCVAEQFYVEGIGRAVT